MKKLFTAALSLVMSLSLLAACSSSPAQSGGTSGSASAGSAMSDVYKRQSTMWP